MNLAERSKSVIISLTVECCSDIIAPILTKFYNVSVETETVISDWKLSKVIPIYMGKGSKDEAGNYRPMSLISHIMKIFEK